jgi:multidrug efflux pump subunit AcrA (membrane-fusion protein)
MMRFLRPLSIALVLLATAGGAFYYYTAILNPGPDAPVASAGPGGPGATPPGATRGGPPQGMGGGPLGGGRPMPVVVARVTEEMFGERVEAIGTTFANESITVSAKVTGIIRAVDFDDGQYVEKGTEIAAIDAGEQDARLNVELANLDEQRKELDRIQGLAKSNNVSQSRLDQQISALRKAEANVAAARARVADYRIPAPFAGVLGTRRVSVGALVSPTSRPSSSISRCPRTSWRRCARGWPSRRRPRPTTTSSSRARWSRSTAGSTSPPARSASAPPFPTPTRASSPAC